MKTNTIISNICATGMAAWLGLASLGMAGLAKAETLKIVMLEGMSGPFSAVGQSAYRELEFAIDQFLDGKIGGLKVELVVLDNMTSPKETLVQFKNAVSQKARVVIQGTSSAVAHALITAVDKHNERNPDDRILYINYASIDPPLTNEKCSFWHFRFDSHIDMKMIAIAEAIRQRPEITKVYVIGQDYSFGKSLSAAARKYLKEKRTDIEIVGDELHPIGKVKDFTPYVTKIKASGAQAVITGNWGTDMVNLAKAANAIGLDADFYTYYAAGTGITAAIGKGGKNRIRMIMEGWMNPPATEEWNRYIAAYKAKYPDFDMFFPRMPMTIAMLAKAIERAGGTEPAAVAAQLEGMEFTRMDGLKAVMRASDHQIQLPLTIAVHTDEGITWDIDKSGFGLREEVTIPAKQVEMPTTCKMKRP